MARKKTAGDMPTKGKEGILEERLTWIQKTGWKIAAVYGAAFVGLVTWYLPREFESSRNLTKSDIESAVGPVRQDLAVLSERLRKQVGFSIQNLIPSREIAQILDPAILKARYQEATSLINTAISERIPTSPAILQDAQRKLQQTASDPKIGGDIRSAATATLVGSEAYTVFSSTLVVVSTPKILVSQDSTFRAPVTIPNSVWLEGTGKEGALITVDFTGTHSPFPHPAAFVLSAGDAILSKMRVKGTESSAEFLVITSDQSTALVDDTRIENLGQKLDGIRWLNVEFVNSVIRYAGQPTYLGNVAFKDCKFEFGTDRVSKRLLGKISQASGPVTIASTVSF
jgi:hypothetical protein